MTLPVNRNVDTIIMNYANVSMFTRFTFGVRRDIPLECN